MDLHFFRGYLYFSIARNNSSNTCQFLELDKMRFTSNIFDSRIERVFRTPCIEDLDNVVLWGGRITSSKQKLFLSIGEQRYDRSGFPKDSLMLKRKSQRVFGSVVEIDPTTKDASIYASGMRNAQGLFWDSDTKQLFESEHGPFGGDEVNILKRGDFMGGPKRLSENLTPPNTLLEKKS